MGSTDFLQTESNAIARMIPCNWSKADTSPYKEIPGDTSFTALPGFKPTSRLPKKNTHNHAGTHSTTFLFTISSLPASYPSLKSPFLCSSASDKASGQKKFQSQGKRTRLSASLLSKHGASGQHNFIGTLAHPLSQ